MPRLSSTLTAILLTVASMFCFAAMNAIIRGLSDTIPTGQMVFLRNVMSLIMIVGWIVARGQHAHFRTDRMKSHLWRAGIGFCAMELWFYGVSIMPLTLAVALSFTTPIFGTIFAIAVLKEKAGWRRWMAIAIGFIGVLIILRPNSAMFDEKSLIILASSALMAMAGVVVKSLTRTQPPETIVFYMALYMTPLSLPFALLHWADVTMAGWTGIFFISLFSTAAHLLMTRAYLRADMVTLLPFDFMRLIFTALLAWIFFQETMDTPTILGALIIMASSVYIAHREAVRRGKIGIGD